MSLNFMLKAAFDSGHSLPGDDRAICLIHQGQLQLPCLHLPLSKPTSQAMVPDWVAGGGYRGGHNRGWGELAL